MLSNPHARATWRLFRARAEWMLGSIAPPARKEIIADLEAHVRDAIAEMDGADEQSKLASVLERLGDPREFLAPLVADAVFKRPGPTNDIAIPVQAVVIAIHSGARQISIAVFHLAALAIGLALAILGTMRIARPQTAGVFLDTFNDTYNIEIRLLGLGSPTGAQILPVWGACLLVLAGIAVVIWSMRGSRRQLTTFFTRAA